MDGLYREASVKYFYFHRNIEIFYKKMLYFFPYNVKILVEVTDNINRPNKVNSFSFHHMEVKIWELSQSIM